MVSAVRGGAGRAVAVNGQSKVQSPESKVGDDAGRCSIRLFVAVRLPEVVLGELSRVQAELKQCLPPKSAAWTKIANLHLTLRFLGNVESGRVGALRSALRESLRNFGGLDLVCERLGCFPDVRFPRVVWAWVHDNAERLARLHRAVTTASEPFAEKPAEKNFTGHVTLARPKQIKRHDAGQLAQFVESAVGRKFGAWRCSEVELIQSQLSPSGSQYSTIEVFPL
ncbi:MAG: RNA 2',3'-cyclic phosphodiesterase [Verrucomicrobia bacterium]|nr:MAG: RNA 2',3'-cyclic phosphodiesterase [Verrucomicrobiota bacterium]